MGKKLKTGKTRRDKYYKLSKEIGYRSRASFKLIQLNQKFGFLQNSKVLLDLCCAPGGWLQVAAKTLPPSSIIMGVDLVPVKPLANVELFQEDITTEKCIHMLKRFLKTCKIDCVLHDGAPNVGSNWLHDAHTQVRLTFHAFKLAAALLAPGGTFVTKLFRSKDYESLLWLLRKFFKRVDSTKPLASRNESAEIYAVCQGFIHYNRVDAKFFDPKFIFQELDDIKTATNKSAGSTNNNVDKNQISFPPKSAFSGLQVSKSDTNNLSKAVDEDSTPIESLKETIDMETAECKDIERLRHRLALQAEKLAKYEHGLEADEASTYKAELISDLDFILSSSHKKLIKEEALKQILLVDPRVRRHSTTTPEIRALCADLKVLGLGDIRTLVKWADKLKKALFTQNTKKSADDKNKEYANMSEDEKIEKKVLAIKSESERLFKAKRRKVAKLKANLIERMRLKMDIPHDITESQGDDLFDLKRFERAKNKNKAHNEPETLLQDLVYDPMDRDDIKVEKWFDRPAFKWLNENVISKMEHVDACDNFHEENTGGQKTNSKTPKLKKEQAIPTVNTMKSHKKLDHKLENEESDYHSMEDDDEQGLEEFEEEEKKGPPSVLNKHAAVNDITYNDDEIEIVPSILNYATSESDNDEDLKLDSPEEMLLATYMKQSQKKKNEVEDNAYHRYAFGEKENSLPDWFVADEKRHYHKTLLEADALPKETVREVFTKYNKQINSRPIKKVIEARARKKSRALKRMAKVVDRAQKFASTSIMAGLDSSTSDNQQQTREALERNLIAKASKKASKGLSAKRDKIYVVSRGRRGTMGTQASRNKKGRGPGKGAKIVKVDRRMKKDDRKRKHDAKSKHGSKGRSSKGKGNKNRKR